MKKHGKKLLTVVAALLSMLGPFTIDTYLPSFPDIEQSFQISRAVLSQSLGIYLAAFALSTLFWGPLSDRIGRRRVVFASLSLYILATLGCALSQGIDHFLLFRFLQGLAASGGFIAGRAMIRDAHDIAGAHKAMSQVMMLFALAPAIAPVLGGWLHDAFGWRSVFVFLMLFALLLMLLLVFVTETLSSEHRQSFHPLSVLQVYTKILKQKQFILIVATISLLFAGVFLYIAGAPTVIYQFLGLGSKDFAWQFIPMVSGLVLGSFCSVILVKHWSRQRIFYFAVAVLLFSVVFNLLNLTLFDASIFTVIAPLVVYAFGLSLLMPVLSIMALDCFPKNRGAASSMQGFFQMMGNALVASFLVPFLHQQWSYFVIGQFVLVVAGLLLWSLIARKVFSNQ